MNKQRRKRLADIIGRLEDLQSEVQSIAEEERECYDNMSDSGLCESERGQQIGENADDLENLDSDFESLIDNLREIQER